MNRVRKENVNSQRGQLNWELSKQRIYGCKNSSFIGKLMNVGNACDPPPPLSTNLGCTTDCTFINQ